MLSPEEQEQIIAEVRRFASVDKARARKVLRHEMTDRRYRELTEAALDRLRDLLKEVG